MITVAELFAVAGLSSSDVVPWGAPPASDAPGVYVVSAASDPAMRTVARTASISVGMTQQLLDARPELTVDGRRPMTVELVNRLREMWLPDENVLYVGLAGTSVRQRVRQYYRTRVGARGPHAGGWPLKTLSSLDHLWVHSALADDPSSVEQLLVQTFAERADVPDGYCDPTCVLPFANLTTPGGRRQRHGIAGARGPKERSASNSGSPASPNARRPTARTADASSTTQRITTKDIESGRIRVPNTAKSRFPADRATIQISVRGQLFEARWDPRDGPDKRRSGVISIPRRDLAGLVRADDRLNIHTEGRTITLS